VAADKAAAEARTKMRQVAPRRGAPHLRLVIELAAPGASRRTMLRHGGVGLRAGEPTGRQPGRAWVA
jgi:hypothetical protein